MNQKAPAPREPTQDEKAAPPDLRYDLAELVAGITPENAHPEVGWGKPQGEEGW